MKEEVLAGTPPTEVFLKAIAEGLADSNAGLANRFVESFPSVPASTKSLIWQWDRLGLGRGLPSSFVDEQLRRLLGESGYIVRDAEA